MGAVTLFHQRLAALFVCTLLCLWPPSAQAAAPHSTSPKYEAIWAPVTRALDSGIYTNNYPGCVALVGDRSGYLYFRALGNFTYGLPLRLDGDTNPPVVEDTLWDLASVSKVIGATSAIAQFYQRGQLDLNTRIVDIIGPQFGTNGKEPITVLNCLLHNAGFPPDPTPYNYYQVEFGCPESAKDYPMEDFSCMNHVWWGLMNQTLENPVGAVYVYSDLSFITLMFVVGRLAQNFGYVTPADFHPHCASFGGVSVDQCYFEAYLRKYVFELLNMTSTGYLPHPSLWKYAAPCENDTITHDYQDRLLQGQVSDGNAYAMGGISGHAGLFTTAADVFTLVHRMMFADDYYKDEIFLNSTTVKYFTTEYNHTQSCRALGWSTNDPSTPDYGWDQCCGDLSPETYMHIGYTGTQVCGDPERKIITVFLTNRVYPTSEQDNMLTFRQDFNNAVRLVLDSTPNIEALRMPNGIQLFERHLSGKH